MAEQQEGTQGLNSKLFGDLNQTRVYTEYPGQVRPLVLLCIREKSWSVLCIQVPRYVGLLYGLRSFLCALVGLPGRAG